MKKPDNVPTLKDIAALVGVSDVTVSNVLRPGKEKRRTLVSEETTQRVLEAARKLGYVPNRVARSMRTRQTGVIGFVTLSFNPVARRVQNVAIQPFLVGLNHIFSPQGRHVALVELSELELGHGEAMPQALRERFFDALVVHWGLSQSAARMIEEFEVPVIYWDSGIYLPKNCVYRDEFEVGRVTAEHLLKLGHRRIGYFLGEKSSWQEYRKGSAPYAAYGLRYKGVCAAMKAYQCSPVKLFGNDPAEHQRIVLEQELTGMIVPSSMQVPFRAISGLAMKIPRDFSALALDLETSIDRRADIGGGAAYNRYEAGRIAAELLTKRLENGGADVDSVILPCEIVDLGSTGPVPRKAGANEVASKSSRRAKLTRSK